MKRSVLCCILILSLLPLFSSPLLDEIISKSVSVHPWLSEDERNGFETAAAEIACSAVDISSWDEYYRAHEIISLLEDGHANYIPEYLDIGYPIIRIAYVGGAYIVIAVKEGYAPTLFRAAEVVSVNGIPTGEYLESEFGDMVGISSDNRYVRLADFLNYGPPGKEIVYELLTRRRSECITVTVSFEKSVSYEVFPELLQPEKKWIYKSDFLGLYYEEDIPVVTCFSMDKNPEAFKEELQINILSKLEEKPDKVIIDLRNNSGGNSMCGIYLLESFSSGVISFPDYYENDSEGVCVFRKGGRYMLPFRTSSADLVVLMNERTVSAAESTAYYASSLDNAILVGNDSAGFTGDTVVMPISKGNLVLTRKRCVNEDGTPFIVHPDILIKESAEDIISGKDVLLDKAVKLLSE